MIEEDSVDLIVDFVGGDYFNKHLHLLKPKGKLIQIACLKGSSVDCNLAVIMRKRLQIIGFVLRSQSLDEKINYGARPIKNGQKLSMKTF